MQSYIKDGQRFIVLDAPIEFYLAHSDDDFLCHFKYIRRYQVDGKWKYVYADKDTHKKINKEKSVIDKQINSIVDTIKVGNIASENWVNERHAINDNPKYDKNEKDKRLKKADDEIERTMNDLDWSLYAASSKLTGHVDEYKKIVGKNSVKTLATAKLDKAKNFIKNIFG